MEQLPGSGSGPCATKGVQPCLLRGRLQADQSAFPADRILLLASSTILQLAAERRWQAEGGISYLRLAERLR
jgi:hypothetical protein